MRFSFQSQVMSAALQIETSVENGVSQPELEENRNHWQHTAIDSSPKRYIIYIFHCLAVVIVAISSCSSGEHKIVDCHARRALRYMSTIRFSLPIRQYQIHCAIVVVVASLCRMLLQLQAIGFLPSHRHSSI